MHCFRKSGSRLILVAAFAWLSICPLYAQGPNGESAKDPLLDTLNGEFRAQYRQALAATLAQAGPLILEEGDDLILVRHGERTRVLVKPVEYHELKAVAHIPLALFVMLSFPQEAQPHCCPPGEPSGLPRADGKRHVRPCLAATLRPSSFRGSKRSLAPRSNYWMMFLPAVR